MKITEKIHILLILISSVCFGEAAAGPMVPGSILSDSLAFPGEVFVITADQLADHTINSVEDILALVPGLSWWREGPTGGEMEFSVDGHTSSGVTLLINGVPFNDPYTDAPLSRFVPLSRLSQVEIVYTGSTALSLQASSGSLVNLVIEEGGREGPLAVADFTNGKSNRRSRRVWFATPESYVNLAFAYDEYLQDASETLYGVPGALLGRYDSRAFLADFKLRTDGGETILLHLHRFEDTFAGTGFSFGLPGSYFSGEEVRYSGFDSWLKYSRGALSVTGRQRFIEMRRQAGLTAGLVTGLSAKWKIAAGRFLLRPFVDAEKLSFENDLWEEGFDPEFETVRGGIVSGGGRPGEWNWRAAVSGGYHSQAGSWIGGEAGIGRGSRGGFYQNILFSRRVRTPSAEELFQPGLPRTVEGLEIETSGNTGLSAEEYDEVSIRCGFFGRLTLDLFARRETDRIRLDENLPARYSSDGKSEVSGGRGRYAGRMKVLGIDCGYSLAAEYFGSRSEYTQGIPEYRLLGSLALKRRSFKDTETVTLIYNVSEVGEREWHDMTLERYSLHDISFSITVMSAIIRVQWNNILDTEYESYPGYLMPGRHLRFGVIWHIMD